MKKSYVKPVLNASMAGTLEGVYAYGNPMGACGFGCWGGHKPYCPEKTKKDSKNSCVPAVRVQIRVWVWDCFPFYGHYEWR